MATAKDLQHAYVTCRSQDRLLLLFTFLKVNIKKKIMVLFSSCHSVEYCYVVSEIFNLDMDLDMGLEYGELMKIHEPTRSCFYCKREFSKRKQKEIFHSFCVASYGILFCTNAAARSLDTSDVDWIVLDWIVQYDPPDNPKEHIYWVDRTVGGEGNSGQALIILRPEELGFLCYFKEARISVNKYEFCWNIIDYMRLQLEKIITGDFYIHSKAVHAFKSYIRAYDLHNLKQVFDIETLDLAKVAKSFGFTIPSTIGLNTIRDKSFLAKSNDFSIFHINNCLSFYKTNPITFEFRDFIYKTEDLGHFHIKSQNWHEL